MGAYNTKDFEERTGLSIEELKASKLVALDKDSSIINFLPTQTHGSNYKKLMNSYMNLNLNSEEMKETLIKYTNHETGYCTTINLLLAADGIKLLEHREFIRKLDYSISMLSHKYPCVIKQTFRGMWLTEKEFDSYLEREFQYIPSFLSSSRNPNKFYKNNRVNCLMIFNIKCNPRRAFEVGKEFSKYETEEEETLFSCYNKFKILKKTKNFNFHGETFEFGIQLEVINEDEKINNAKILAILNCF